MKFDFLEFFVCKTKMSSASGKTIFILDHSPSMSRKVQKPVNLSYALEKASKTTDAPKIEVAQTLWTCAVQAMSEYCRIVWDIFGNERSVLFFVGDYNRTPKEWLITSNAVT